MKILLVAATKFEILPFIHHLEQQTGAPCIFAKVKNTVSFKLANTEIVLLISGIGIHETTYNLTKHLYTHLEYDYALQAGIGGSFDDSIPLGTVVLIGEDQFGDLGAENHDKYLDLFDMGLVKTKEELIFFNRNIQETLPANWQLKSLPKVSALTVNTVSGCEKTIETRKVKYNCIVESMEGAAFQSVCIKENLPFLQLRAISNYVTPRDKSKWKMDVAIANLNNWLMENLC